MVIAAFAAVADDHVPPITVAAIQLEADAVMYSSVAAFRRRISELVGRAADQTPHLAVFPEYTSALIALIPYHAAIEGTDTIEEAWHRILVHDPTLANLQALFLRQSGFVEKIMDDVFGQLARGHNVTILAGSYFARHLTETKEEQLRNRAVVYDRFGARTYHQDKVFLTDFEVDVVAISPGRLKDARGVPINGRMVSVSICRDTFLTEWERHFAEIDVWIDIKANGALYTPEMEELFRRALPARIASSSVPYGITTCLTGGFLDLFWQGVSSAVRKEESGFEIVGATSTAAGEEILLVTLR